MGKSVSTSALVKKLDQAADALTSNRQAMQVTGTAAKEVFAVEAMRRGVGRGVGRTPVSSKVSARYDVKGERDASLVVRYTGPAHLLNNPTKAHVIRPRAFVGTRGTGARAQKAAGLLAAFGLDARTSDHALGGGVAALAGHPVQVVFHPGTQGLHFFQRAKVECEQQLPKVYKRVGVEAPLRAVFG